MTCIRTCNLEFLTSECVAAPACACRSVPTLRLVWGCVHSRCPAANVDAFYNGVSQACGQGQANAMAARPPRPSTPSRAPGRPPTEGTGAPPPRSETLVATSTRVALDPTTTFTTSRSASVSITSTSPTMKSIEDQTPSDQIEAPKNNQPTLIANPVISFASDSSPELVSTSAAVDAFGGALGQISEKEDNPVPASSTQSLLIDSPNGSQEGQVMTGDSRADVETDSGQTPAITIPGDSLAPVDGSAAGEQTSGSPSTGKTPIIGGAMAAVVVVATISGLLYFCLKRHRRRRELKGTQDNSGAMRVVDPAPFIDHWAQFDSPSPVTEKRELSSQDVLEKVKTKNATDIADALQAIMAANASTASDRSDHVLYSHFQDVMPPPSMRSKRNSRTTMHTLRSDGENTSGAGFGTLHPSDSQTQISYPFERPPSSTCSIATILSPPHNLDGSFRASPHALLPLTTASEFRTAPALPLDFGIGGDSNNARAQSGPTVSRSSTVTDVSFRAIGSEEDVGRAL